jgi:rhodanese-related sulfurtransferase
METSVMYRILTAPVAALLCFILFSAQPANAQLGSLFGTSPRVDTISLSELKEKLDTRERQALTASKAGQEAPESDFVLVDVRSDEEVNVSVIPGAITKAEYEKNRAQYNGRTVIPYCTIGGRSAKYASILQKEGVPVKNFEGSILEWVSAELPLVTLDGKETNRVHIYSDRYKIPAKYEPITR